MDRLEFIPKECCLVSCNRKASLLQSDILKFANSLKLPCKQIFFGQTICKQFFSSFCLLQKFFVIFGTPSPVNIKWFVLICLLTSLKPFPGPLLKSGVGPFVRYGNHKEMISERYKQMYTQSDKRLEWLREERDHYSFQTPINAGGPKCSHYLSHFLDHH